MCEYMNTNDLSNMQVVIKINVKLNKSHITMKTKLQKVSTGIIFFNYASGVEARMSGLVARPPGIPRNLPS